MKVKLIHKFSQFYFPFLQLFNILTVKFLRLIPFTYKFYAVGNPKFFLLRANLCPQNLKNSLKPNIESFADLPIFRHVIKQYFLSKDDSHGVLLVLGQIEY